MHPGLMMFPSMQGAPVLSVNGAPVIGLTGFRNAGAEAR